jgi:hypothetical protein
MAWAREIRYAPVPIPIGLGMGNSSVHMVLALAAQEACSIAINEGLVRLPRVDGVRGPLAV